MQTSHWVPDAAAVVETTDALAAGEPVLRPVTATVAAAAVDVNAALVPAPMPIILPSALSSLAAFTDLGPAVFFSALLTAAVNFFGLKTDSRRCGIGFGGRPTGLAGVATSSGGGSGSRGGGGGGGGAEVGVEVLVVEGGSTAAAAATGIGVDAAGGVCNGCNGVRSGCDGRRRWGRNFQTERTLY